MKKQKWTHQVMLAHDLRAQKFNETFSRTNTTMSEGSVSIKLSPLLYHKTIGYQRSCIDERWGRGLAIASKDIPRVLIMFDAASGTQ